LAEQPEPVAPGWYPDPRAPSSGRQRYWSGNQWENQIREAEELPPPTAGLSTTRRSSDERRAILAEQVRMAATRGLRVESQSDYQAMLIEGRQVNHTLHAILTIFTCLIWGLVWAAITATGGERRHMIVVDEFGNVQHLRLAKT
jgi:hypothetical protein